MMLLRAAIGGAPLSVCHGEEVPLTYAMLARSLAAGPALTLPARAPSAFACPRGASLAHRPVHVAFSIGWTSPAGALFQLAGPRQGGQDRGQCSRPTTSGSQVR